MRGAVQRQRGWMRGGSRHRDRDMGTSGARVGAAAPQSVQGGRRKPSGGSVPTHSPAVAPGAQRPAQRGADGDHQLTNYGQGHLKTWPLQHRGCKGKRRQVVGHRHAPRRLDGNKGWWLMRGTGRTPAAPHASPGGERRKKIKEEKRDLKVGGKVGFMESCESGSASGTAPRHRAPCEDGKETHGHSRSQPAERSGRHGGGGREEGRGLLPSRGPTRSTPGAGSRRGAAPLACSTALAARLSGDSQDAAQRREQRASG